MSIIEAKKQLRREVRAAKDAMSGQERQEASEMIMRKVEELEEFEEANTVLIYSSLPDEVLTDAFISRWYERKRILLPVVQGEDLILRQYSPEHVREGYKGIMEPDETAPEASPERVGLALIPGMAFDRSGGRLGRGKGFYDRLLPQLHCPLIGLCYACQIVDEVPRDSFDIKVDKVICEKMLNL